VGSLGCQWCGYCGCGKLREIGGANVTVSRTHTGFSLCFQIITILNRFGAKQGSALFSDTCEKQRLSYPPKFNIAARVAEGPAHFGSLPALGLGKRAPLS
jgi:hypothetical protein